MRFGTGQRTTWFCWKENDYTGRRLVLEVLEDLWWVQSSSVTVLTLFFLPQPCRFLRFFSQMLQGCSANECNAALELHHPAGGSPYCKPLPFLLWKASPGLQALGKASIPSKCWGGDASHFPWAWTLSEELRRATQTPQNLLDSSPIDSTARSSFNW